MQKPIKFIYALLVIIIIAGGISFLILNQAGKIEIKDRQEVSFNNNSQRKIIFETNLPDISENLGSNLFVTTETSGDTYKNIKVMIRENGVEKEIVNTNLETVLAMIESEAIYEKSSEIFFGIKALKLKNDSEIGIIHENLKIDDFKYSSGYIIDETMIANRKNLCLPTSMIYNNWVCFVYNKEKGDLILSYAQNFAD